MPKQNRWRIKERLEAAVGNIEAAQGKLGEEAVPFETVHPELFEAFRAAVVLLEEVKTVVTRLSERI